MPDKPSNTIWKRAMRSLASGVGAGTLVLIATLVFHQYDVGHTFRAMGFFAIAGGCGAALPVSFGGRLSKKMAINHKVSTNPFNGRWCFGQ